MDFLIGNSPRFATNRIVSPSSLDGSATNITRASAPGQQQELSGDIEQSVEEYKALSLAFQLMQAIARQNEKLQSADQSTTSKLPYKNNNSLQTDNHSISHFNLHQSTAQFIEFSLSDLPSNLTGSFNMSFEFTHSETFQFSFNQSNSETTLELSISRQTQTSFQIISTTEAVEKSDPLILNLDDSDFSFNPNETVTFDLDADGTLDQFANLAIGNAFLAFDKNSNGKIDSGHELFGDTGGEINGFADLANYDDNADQIIDANDRIFNSLLLMEFDNQSNQYTQSLNDQNITSISLQETLTQKNYQQDNELIAEAEFSRDDGSKGVIGDFLLSIS